MNRFQLRPGWSGSRLVMLAVVAFLGLGPLAILFRVAGATPDRQVVANSGSVLQLLFAGGDIRHSQAVAWGDIEGDGDLDLYVGNGIYPQWISWLDYSPYNPTDQVYINNGRGRFTIRDIADEPADGSDTRGVAWGDMDGDGDLDVAAGTNNQDNNIWWWENPYPNYGSDWTRRVIKDSGANKHHDMMFGNFDDDPGAELVFWNQGAAQLSLVNVPADPRGTQPWPGVTTVWTAPSNQYEGLTQADVDGDGGSDIIGGGRWFKREGNGFGSLQGMAVEAQNQYAATDADDARPGQRRQCLTQRECR